MKKINTAQTYEDAKRLGVSPFLLMKKRLHYRESFSEKRSCLVCSNQCNIIGLSLDGESVISNDNVCDNFTTLKERSKK